MQDDLRLIEDYIPIEAISEESRREKSIRKGHISTLHLWWARRPLVAARAAVYGALVPAPKDKKAAKDADKFVQALCKYPGSEKVIAEAKQHILQAHADRLTAERGELITVADIETGRAPRPRVLDMFAGGGAIPLEALRLGCEAHAVDLNPVAHMIELCTLVYPQKYGNPDPSTKGSAPDGTWAGLASEVDYWGKWILKQARKEIGDLYPTIPYQAKSTDKVQPSQLNMNLAVLDDQDINKEALIPVAYLWTRTVRCKNRLCGAEVPLARQTWLARKKGYFVALQPILSSCEEPNVENQITKKISYRVVKADTELGVGFNPSAGSKGGNVACPFCGTVADSKYVKEEGISKRIGIQPLGVIGTSQGKNSKIYLSIEQVSPESWPDELKIKERIKTLISNSVSSSPIALSLPDEEIVNDAKGSAWIVQYGYTKFSDLFTQRQLLSLLTFVSLVHRASKLISTEGYSEERAKVITTYLGVMVSRFSDYSSSLCTLNQTGGRGTAHTFVRQALPMVWDFAESNPFNNIGANWNSCISAAVSTIRKLPMDNPALVTRGDAANLIYPQDHFDAVITDPPYYDNVPYSNISDYFFVWLKRSIGHLYPEHFSYGLTPKKKEAVADATRYDNNREEASRAYENMMAKAFKDAGRVLRPGAPMIVVYAHKTTLGWSTLINALRTAGFTVTEAWPIDTEKTGRLRDQNSAALASSIFLISRMRDEGLTGSYENAVRPELHKVVRESIERLWSRGVTGADLVIACVGAGLRAFTRYSQVEYANGEPVPADSFLSEVEGEVLEALLEKLFGVNTAGIGSVDAPTRFYLLWRFAYRQAALDAGEAIVFAYPQRVELEGPHGLTSGTNPLLRREKNQYILSDFTQRGQDEELGIPNEGYTPRLIDVLHRLLWLVENQPAYIPAFLDKARPDIERLRIVSQTLAGQTLSGNGEGGGKSLIAARGAEASALRKLTTNWRTLIESHRGPMV